MTFTLQSPPPPTSKAPETVRWTALAWVGWQLKLPENWRPHKIEGGFSKGQMFIGDDQNPYFMIRWWRPDLEGIKNFDRERWLQKRFQKLHALPQSDPPAPPGFALTAWVKDLQKKQDLSRTLWYGCAAHSDTVIELKMTSLTPAGIRRRIENDIWPTLRITSPEEPIRWSLFSAHFQSPPGFILEESHLFSGDIALHLVRKKERLVLRTVYPAELALSRRKLSVWLEEGPFLDRRRKGRFEWRDWTSSAAPLRGTLRTGIRRFPFPLGGLTPRHSTALAAVDSEHDRLFTAEYQAPGCHAVPLVETAVEDMAGGNPS
jgi:hypothetical protein